MGSRFYYDRARRPLSMGAQWTPNSHTAEGRVRTAAEAEGCIGGSGANTTRAWPLRFQMAFVTSSKSSKECPLTPGTEFQVSGEAEGCCPTQ
jgi:hypothetical protein